MPRICCSKLYFLHIPKTGGAWLGRVLPSRQVDGSEHSHVLGKLAEKRTVFTIVRSPASWLISLWGHFDRHGRGMSEPPGFVMGEMAQQLLTDCYKWDMKCETFLLNYLQNHRGKVTKIFDQYTEHADRVLHTERLRTGLAQLLYEVGDLTPELQKKIFEMPKFNCMPDSQRIHKVHANVSQDLRNQVNFWEWRPL